MSFLINEDADPLLDDSGDDSDLSDVEMRGYRVEAKRHRTGPRRDLAPSTKALLEEKQKIWQR